MIMMLSDVKQFAREVDQLSYPRFEDKEIHIQMINEIKISTFMIFRGRHQGLIIFDSRITDSNYRNDIVDTPYLSLCQSGRLTLDLGIP